MRLFFGTTFIDRLATATRFLKRYCIKTQQNWHLGTKQKDCLEIILFTKVSEDIFLDPGMAHGRHENGPFSAATTTVSKMQNKRIYH